MDRVERRFHEGAQRDIPCNEKRAWFTIPPRGRHKPNRATRAASLLFRPLNHAEKRSHKGRKPPKKPHYFVSAGDLLSIEKEF